MPIHPLDATIALAPIGDGRYAGRTHAAYANMVGPFGGAIGATLLNAVMGHAARLGDPVALTTYFHADAAQLAAQGTAPLLGVAQALHFGQGFFDQSAEVWSAQGELLAASHQVVYFKE